MSSVTWRPFCLGLNVLMPSAQHETFPSVMVPSRHVSNWLPCPQYIFPTSYTLLPPFKACNGPVRSHVYYQGLTSQTFAGNNGVNAICKSIKPSFTELGHWTERHVGNMILAGRKWTWTQSHMLGWYRYGAWYEIYTFDLWNNDYRTFDTNCLIGIPHITFVSYWF